MAIMDMVGRWRLPARLGRLALILCLLLKGMRIPRMMRQNDNAYEGVPTGAASDNDTPDRQKRLPSLLVPTLSFSRGRTARRVGPWLLLLALAVAAFPAATGGFRAARAVAANAGVRPADSGNYAVIDLGASANFKVSGGTAYAINDCNQVVGDYYNAGGSSHAFIWNPTGPTTGVMDDLGVGDGSHAYGINNLGHVVGQGAGGAYIAIAPMSAATASPTDTPVPTTGASPITCASPTTSPTASASPTASTTNPTITSTTNPTITSTTNPTITSTTNPTITSTTNPTITPTTNPTITSTTNPTITPTTNPTITPTTNPTITPTTNPTITPTTNPTITPTTNPTITPTTDATTNPASPTAGGSNQTCGPSSAPTRTPTPSSAPTQTPTPTCGPTTPTSVPTSTATSTTGAHAHLAASAHAAVRPTGAHPAAIGPYMVTTLVPGGIAYGINNLDAVVGTSGGKAFIRTADPHDPSAVGNVASIGASNCGSSDARAINSSGAIVGSACGSYAAGSNGSSPMSYIGSLGGRASRAYALNSSGQAGGYSYVPGNYEVHAVLWDPSATGSYPTSDSTHSDLGNIGGSFATILGINDDGVSVGYGTTGTGQPHAAISRVGQTLSDLNDYIDPGSGWTLSHAYAINSNGVIVGDARTQDSNGNPTGPMHAVLLLPPGVSLLPPPDATATATARATPTGGAGSTKTPELTVTSSPVDFTGSFLQGIPLTETVTANVTWNGYLPGFVDFILDGKLVSEVSVYNGKHALTSTVTYDFNGGTIGEGPHVLRVVAGSGDVNPVKSNVKTFTVCGVAMPNWLTYMINHHYIGPFVSTGRSITWSANLDLVGIGAKFPRIAALAKRLKDSEIDVKLKFAVTYLFAANPNSLTVSVELSGAVPFAKKNLINKVAPNIKLVPVKLLGFNTEIKVIASGSLEAQVNHCHFGTLNGTIGISGEGKAVWRKSTLLFFAELAADAATDGAATFLHPVFQYLDNGLFNTLGNVYIEVGGGAGVQFAGTTYDNGNPPYFNFLYPDGISTVIYPFTEGGYEMTYPVGVKVYLKGTLTGTWKNRLPGSDPLCQGLIGRLPDKATFLGQAGALLKFPNLVEFERSYNLTYT